MSEKPHIGVKILIHFLSFLAGFVNGIFFITAGTAVSHHTGNLTRFVLGLSKGAIAEVITMLALLLSFSTGACVSGIIFHRLFNRCWAFFWYAVMRTEKADGSMFTVSFRYYLLCSRSRNCLFFAECGFLLYNCSSVFSGSGVLFYFLSLFFVFMVISLITAKNLFLYADDIRVRFY